MVKRLLLISFLLLSLTAFSQKSLSKVTAAPNPFVNNTTISIESTIDQTVLFSVRNVIGKTVYRKEVVLKKGKNNVPFSKNDLQNGMYIYAIQNSTELISKRLVIK